MYKIFIDGSAGTTGLRIRERLLSDKEISIIEIPEELRKDNTKRSECMNQADVVFLCLPDAAAIEAVSLVTNPDTVIIDTSTAHRVAEGWTYGFPELSGLREKIRSAKRIANPGCHASGFISLVEPLVRKGIISKDAKLSCFSLTGYSGGGKKMIADYDLPENKEKLLAPRLYGLSQNHKHLPEMAKICGLVNAPVFCPIVSSYYSGMEVVVELSGEDVNGSIADIKNCYESYYTDGLVNYKEVGDENGFISAGGLSGLDNMEVSVYGNDDRILLISKFDNLGKGASGAAIQNMNIVLGRDEKTGLVC